MGDIEIPRNFLLLDELEYFEKNQTGSFPDVSAGLKNHDDQNVKTLTNWTALIVGPARTTFDMNFYKLAVEVGPGYPQEAPKLQFTTPVKIPNFVRSNGEVKVDKLKNFQWSKKENLRSLLTAIRSNMALPANAKIAQPPIP